MRKSDLKKLIKSEADSICPNFDAMLAAINAEPVERERIVDTSVIAPPKASSKRISRKYTWRDTQKSRTVSKTGLAAGAMSFCFALMLTVAGMFSIGYWSKSEIPDIIIKGADTYVSLNINPGVDFTVNKYNKITSAVATNSGGTLLITKLCDELGVDTLVGRELTDALVDTIDVAAKMGYIDVDAVGISNAMMISVIAGDDKKADALKNDLAGESKKYFADNGIYAVVVTDYDNKQSLVEEAKKNNPDLDESSSVGDLIASVEQNNADKSALQAEIEEARKNYESYLLKSFAENKDKAVNKYISSSNTDILRLERLLDELNAMLEEKTIAGGSAPSEGGSESADAVIAALQEEISAKTALYEKRLSALNAEEENAEARIKEAETAKAEIASALTRIETQQADLNIKLASLNADSFALNERLNFLLAKHDALTNDYKNAGSVYGFFQKSENWLIKTTDERAKQLVAYINANKMFFKVVIDPNATNEKFSQMLTEGANIAWEKCFGTPIVTTQIIERNQIVNSIIDSFKANVYFAYNESVAEGTKAVIEALGYDSFYEIYGITDAAHAMEIIRDESKIVKQEIGIVNEDIRLNDAVIHDVNVNSAILETSAKSLIETIAKLDDGIAADNAAIDTVKAEKARVRADYEAELRVIIGKVQRSLSECANTRDSLRAFRDAYKQGDRLAGYDALNDELSALEAKLKEDIEKNDADALAKNLEADIKNSANERYAENVDKFNNHDRKFTAEEYEAWEAEQKALVDSMDWDTIYKAWLENNT